LGGDELFLEHLIMSFGKQIFFACTAWLALGMLCEPNAWAGEIIYKSIGPKGEITYAWRPQPNAVRTEAIEVETLSPEARRAAKQLRLEEQKTAQRVDANARALEDQWRRVDQEIKDALAGVQKAEADLRDGRTPYPGERLGIAGGGSQLTQAYFDRIHELELAVQQAKQRLDNAYAARNELK
jgi:hypothetical protein